MSDRNFGRRRRGGMRFRPAGGFGNKPDRSAQEARAEAVGEKPPEAPFERARHQQEIERAENVAAGLPPEGQRPKRPRRSRSRPGGDASSGSLTWTPRRQVEEEKFEMVPLAEPQPKGLVENLKARVTKVVKRVQRMIKPEARTDKHIIINAESLETRVAVVEQGRLEEFTIERTTEERLVGSVFKGKVRNLQDDLKAAFVDIGFEKNAFLHYWDIIPTPFDSGVEVVERETKRRDRPRITQKDIPRHYPPGSEIIVQVTKGPIGTKGPRVTTNLVLPGRYLVLLPALRPERHFAQDRKSGRAPAPQEHPARTANPGGHGGHHAHRRARARGRPISSATWLCCWKAGLKSRRRSEPSRRRPAFFRNPT